MIFRYEGFFNNGKKTKGFIHADDLFSAKEKLIEREILLTSLKEAPSEKLKALSKKDLLLFTKELAKLIEAGMPLFEALSLLEEKYVRHNAHPLLVDLCNSVKQGSSFSSALKRHPFCFDPLYLSLIENAEKTGSLVKALNELYRLQSKSLTLKKQLFSALLYPVLLGGFCLLILGTLLFYIVPSLFELFEGRSVHPLTSFVLSLSRMAVNNKLTLLLCLILLGGGSALSFLSQNGKNFFWRIALKLPLLKDLLEKTALVRFCRSGGALLQSGVPFLDTLRLSRKVIRHPLMEKAFEEGEKSLLAGRKVSLALEKFPLIPSLFTRMLALAETGGNLSQMLQHLAEIYEEELEKHITRITSLAQPLLLIFLGLVVGFVLLAVLLPLTDVGSFLEKT